jgi:succinylglutamic semialdehyde dehydrogenase
MSHWIQGAPHAGAGAAFASINPADGSVVWSGHEASTEDTAAAVAAAAAVFRSWSGTPLARRIGVLSAFRDLLRAEGEDLACTIGREIGKPLWEARGEVATMAAKVDISITAHLHRTGEHQAATAEGASLLRHLPHGVFAVYGPYNFPGHLPNGHIVPALLAGNTVVFKPSEHAPLTALKTAALWQRAGLPNGVLNVVNGGRATGAALAAQAAIAGILFTGSFRTGVALHRQFAGQPGKLLALEMGGNNPLVVWRTEAVAAAVHHTVFSAFVSAGQRCTCARRLILEEGAWGDQFLAELLRVAGGLRIGRWDAEPQPFMGPVVAADMARGIRQAEAELVARGAKRLLPMRMIEEDGAFLSAGLLEVSGIPGLPDEEIFGPLLQVHRARDFEHALSLANATQYGLAAGLIGGEAAHWERFEREVRAGIINWNRPTTGAASSAPFGGIGHSGNFRPSAYYAADYCAYPVASMTAPRPELPAKLSPGLSL